MSNIKLHEHSALPSNIHINVVRHVQKVTSKKDFIVLHEGVLPLSRFEMQDVVEYKERSAGAKRKREDKAEDCLETPEGSESSSATQPTPTFLVRDKKLDDENSLWDALELELLFGEKDVDNTHSRSTLWVLEDDDDDNNNKQSVCAAQ